MLRVIAAPGRSLMALDESPPTGQDVMQLGLRLPKWGLWHTPIWQHLVFSE
jgi:hypothetical protein